MANYTAEEARTPMPYILYRAWAKDVLLYIGITTSRRHRFRLHGATHKWHLRTHVTTEPIGVINRHAARSIESQAIRDEQPLLNTMGNACILPSCESSATADLMCHRHSQDYVIPWPWAVHTLLAIRAGESQPLDRRKTRQL